MPEIQNQLLFHEDTGSLQYEGEDVLHWSINLPDFTQSHEIHKRCIQYYKKVSQTWEHHWQKQVYPQVCQELQEKRKISHPFYPWKVTLTANFLAISPEKASISITSTQKKGKGITFFYICSDLWNTEKGFPLNPLKEEPLCHWRKKEFLDKILEQATKDDNIKLISNYQDEIISQFPKKQIFLKENTLEIYYPQATIALAEEGIAKFTISL